MKQTAALKRISGERERDRTRDCLKYVQPKRRGPRRRRRGGGGGGTMIDTRPDANVLYQSAKEPELSYRLNFMNLGAARPAHAYVLLIRGAETPRAASPPSARARPAGAGRLTSDNKMFQP
ncbi:hypothetical protein EVAR_47669_1 [Eumeta japonica]|uniref:Uncharacterized protein n=1 Tax=Eumeta variegata TaxID=151549 RepID=A0A4C1XZV7_EUMVA|nr:hypothetical protein EVAR_47669_1 [Eumeta japonica]